MTLHPALRADIAPFHVMEVMRAAAEREAAGLEVLHLEVGQPATAAPSGVIDAARAALDDDRLGYTTALGLDVVRDAIAQHYADRHRIAVERDDVVVTVGASGGCVLAFLSAFDAGDRVGVLAPGYPCYRNMLEAFGVEVVGVEVGPDTHYRPTPDLLDAAGRLDGVVLASPANPTGTMLDAAAIDELAGWAAERGVRVISDEIYHGLGYGPDEHTWWAVDRSAVVVNSFSKYFSMTGWRLGWMLVPADLRAAVERLAQNLFISAPTLSQLAAVAAFGCHDELAANVERYRTNREILLDGLRAAGIDRLAPADGAFYVYADVSHLTDDSQALCASWLDELGVATTPGIDFDPRRGHRFVRFSFAGATADITEAVARLRRHLLP